MAYPATFKPYRFKVNYEYYLSTSKRVRMVKFIRTTKRGFNLEDVETGKLVFKKHQYPLENNRELNMLTLALPEFMKFTPKIALWETWDGRVVKAENIDHQHLSNIYYYTHYTRKLHYSDLDRKQIQRLLDDNFDGEILSYRPQKKFKEEILRLEELGWLKKNGEIIVTQDYQHFKLGELV